MLHKHHFLQKNSMNRDLSQVATTTTVTPRGFKHFKLKAYEKACHIDSQQCARHATCGSGRRCQFLHMVRSRQANCGFSELLCPKFLLCSWRWSGPQTGTFYNASSHLSQCFWHQVSRRTTSGTKRNGATIWVGTKIFKRWSCIRSSLNLFHSAELPPGFKSIFGSIFLEACLVRATAAQNLKSQPGESQRGSQYSLTAAA